MITQERLKEVIRYEPHTGEFIWVSSTSKKKLVGKLAGWCDEDGYLWIRIDKVLYAAQRLAWLFMKGELPKNGFVDHFDTNPSNNKWTNLRDVTKQVNQENRRRPAKNNKAGLLGVSPNGKRWAATINTTENGMRKHYYLGTFDTPTEAHNVYVKSKRKLHQGCTL